MQQETGELKESEDGTAEFETPMDDEEVTIPSQDRSRETYNFPDTDIRDEETLSNTQREDWLLPTESLHGPIDATGNTDVRKPSRTFLLSPGWRILMEEEVFTLPRGGGGVRHLSLSVHHVRYEPYLNSSLVGFRRTVYGMAVSVKVILGRR